MTCHINCITQAAGTLPKDQSKQLNSEYHADYNILIVTLVDKVNMIYYVNLCQFRDKILCVQEFYDKIDKTSK